MPTDAAPDGSAATDGGDAPADAPFADADDTRAAIMRATYRALCEHGYADLTIQRIGDEFEKSKSLLYHHYDGKDDLLVDFLAFVLDRFEADAAVEEYDDAREHLDALLDHLLPREMDPERRQFTAAMVELRGQAPHDAAYREQFTRTDRAFHDRLAGVIRRGVEQGAFREVDPEAVAEMLLTTVHGAMARRATTDDADWVPAVRREVDAYVERRLLADDGAEADDAGDATDSDDATTDDGAGTR